MIEDNFRHQGLRRQLVDALRDKGIENEQVLNAIGTIPRHAFMDKAFLEYAYEDKAFPIAADQTISQPYTVGFQTQLLDVKPGMKVLEIGTGSGYQTAVLCKMGCRVFSIERHKVLHQRANKILKDLGFSPKLFFGDGFKGLPAFAPFDRILVTCGAAAVPEVLLDQLKIGGKMVVPVGPSKEQVMTLLLKNDINDYSRSAHGIFRFVPMLRHKAN